MNVIVFASVLALVSSIRADDGDQQPFYRIPDPFGGGGWANELNKIKGYYAIDSFQSSLSSTREAEQFEVQEYFSLEEGLTFSLQRNHNDQSKVLVIIGDSNHDKTYVVARSGQGEDLECELDNVHHHRFVFPWVFKYKLAEKSPDNDTGKSKRRRKLTDRQGFVYGIGGIWLNAIDRKIISDLVGASSPVPGSNVWTMEEGDLRVRLLFDKPDPEGDEQSIASSKLNHVRIKRLGIVGHNGQSTRFYGSELKDVFVRGVKKISDPQQDETLSWLLSLIGECRSRNRKHRVFPSLVQAASISPDRLFNIQYVETKFPLAEDLKSGSFDPSRRRRVFDREYHSEWLSFKRQTFSVLHQGLDKSNADGEQDMFIKRFAQNRDGHAQSAVSYHQVFKAGSLRSCLEGEAEHAPHDSLMVRALHFEQAEAHRLSGLLHGLGALLMNALDVHHKQYSLFKKVILLVEDPADLESRPQVEANEWRFLDKGSSRTVHFYFKYRNIKRRAHEIADLIRVDIRRATRESDEDAIPIRDEPDVDGGDDPELMIRRFDILRFSMEAQPNEIDSALRPAEMCRAGGFRDDDQDSELADHFDQNDADFSDLSDKFNRIDSESFEFEPGKTLSSLEFPDFFEYLSGAPAYTVESTVEIQLADETEPRFVDLRELVDLETQQSVLSLKLGDESIQPDVEYYLNYNSETVFRVQVGSKECRLVDRVEDQWLEDLSADLTYLRVPGRSVGQPDPDPDALKELAIVESSKLRSHGVGALWRAAASSEDSDFVGVKKEIILKGDASYKEAIWSWEANDAKAGNVEFGFYWNLSRWREDQEVKRSRRTIELLDLNWIKLANSLQRMRIHPISLSSGSSAAWSLPSFCSDAIAEADRISEREARILVDKIKIPSIWDFAGASKTYEIHYTISHSSLSQHSSGEKTSSEQAGSRLTILESFDGQQARAKLAITPDIRRPEISDAREIFIEGNSDKICVFFVEEQTCRRLGRLESLVELDGPSSSAGRGLRTDKLHGLGALWVELAQLEKATLKMSSQLLNSGTKREIRTYRVESGAFTIQMKFAADLAGPTRSAGSARYEPDLVLQQIDLLPKQPEVHRVTIDILSLSRRPPNDRWNLPEACISAMDSDDEPAAKSFPRISQLLQDVEVLHVRSEVTSSSPLVGAAKSLFLLDEWFYAGKEKIRIKSSRLAQNLDILLLVDSKESFDLSRLFDCRTDLPKMLSSSRGDSSKVMNFWRDEETLVAKLSELYFAPVALWWLAEKNLANVRLSSSMDLAPPPGSAASGARLESWLVTSPPDLKPAWKFELNFGRSTELVALESITLADPEYLGLTTKVEISVVSSKFEQATPAKMMDQFMIPEGFGCPRGQWILDSMQGSPDDLVLSADSPHKISYEASLELNSEAGSLLLPTLSGRLLSSGRKREDKTEPDRRSIEVLVHDSRSRLADGTSRSTRHVFDKSNNLLFDVDRSTGFCAVDRVHSYDWTLLFSGSMNDSDPKLVTLGEQTIRLLFLDTLGQKFVPINRLDFGGVRRSTYELRVDNLELSEHLRGPATVMRSYENLEWNPPVVRFERGRTMRLHDSLHVKVLLFAHESRQKVRATLAIRLTKAFNTDLCAVLNAIDVAQCYSQGSPSSDRRSSMFAVEYNDLDMDALEWIVFNTEAVKCRFSQALVQSARILPFQFVSGPEIDFSRFEPLERLIRITFALLDPPTAIEYFDGGPKTDLNSSYSAFGELAIVEDAQACSRWCDSVDCTALTFCASHLCRVVTDNMLQQNGTLLEAIKQGQAGEESEECSLFFYGRPQFERPQTMESFVSFADFAINEGQNLAEAFALSLNGSRAWPSKFTQEPDDLWSFREDTKSPSAGYSLLANDACLDLSALVSSGLRESAYAVAHSQVASYANCLLECVTAKCMLSAFSERSTVCLTITGSGQLKPLLAKIEPCQDTDTSRYTLTARNYLNEYKRFGRTGRPQRYKRRLENHTAIECASACTGSASSERNRPSCLSFDHCHLSNSCFLQSSHIVLDTLDHRILQNQLGDDSAECEHFSKSVAADFEKLPNRRYLDGGPVERGVDLERCAMSCHENELCLAFEFCFDDRHKPAQSCLLITTDGHRDPTANNLEDFLFPAAACSVYRLAHIEANVGGQMENLSPNSHVGLTLQSKLWSLIGWPALILIFSLLAGLLVKLALYKLFGVGLAPLDVVASG